MAAPVGKALGVSDDSSSSDEEERKRFEEAVWETQSNKTKDGDSSVKESKRVVVADHDHDGNELQVTQGFQKHVAKKLGHFLDSCISVMEPGSSLSVESGKCNGDDEDDGGFRLFSTSVPGQKDPPATVRNKPVPSSSDSDSEMESRLREAAVSVRELLPSSTLDSKPSPPGSEPASSDKIKKKKKKKKKKASDGEESQVVEKKKKREENQEESEQVDSAGSATHGHSNGEHVDSEQVKKRKKKKRRKGNTEGEVLD